MEEFRLKSVTSQDEVFKNNLSAEPWEAQSHPGVGLDGLQGPSNPNQFGILFIPGCRLGIFQLPEPSLYLFKPQSRAVQAGGVCLLLTLLDPGAPGFQIPRKKSKFQPTELPRGANPRKSDCKQH